MENKYDYEYDKFREAGKASFEALTYAKELVKPGKKLIDTANELEKFMKDKGFGLAFPVNISINENAAHYTPTVNDESVFTNNDLVKIDLGARKDTYLQDCAVTIDLSGKYANFVDTAQKALQEAISSVKAGRKVCEIGAAVEKVVKGAGLKPIENLGGHGISEEDLHADIFIPNYDNGDDTALEEGQVVALEPFITNGMGHVIEGEHLQIYQKLGNVNARSEDTRRISEFIDKNYSTYPFAVRWLVNAFGSEFKVRRGLNELAALGALESFPVLVEKGKGIVAQAEASVIVQKDGCEVLTK